MQHYIHCSFSPSLSCSIFSCGCHTILRCFTEQQQNKTTFYQYWFLCTCSLYRGRGKKCLQIDVCLTTSLGLNRNHIHVVLSATILVCHVPRTLPCPARSACVRIKVNLFLQRNIIPLKILKVEMCSQYWPAKYFSAIGRHTNPSIYRCTKILDFRKSLVKENVVLNWDSYIIVGLVSSTTLLQWKSSEHISFHCKIVHLSWLFICTFN